jgi:hypothetical protein
VALRLQRQGHSRYTLRVFRRAAFIVGLLLLCLELAGAVLLVREGLRLGRSARAIPAEERAGLQALSGQSPSHLDPTALTAGLAHVTAAAGAAEQVLAAAGRWRPLLTPALRTPAANLEYRQSVAALTAVVDGGALAGQLSALGTSLLNAATTATRQALLQQLTQQQPALASALVLSSDMDREVSAVRGGRLQQMLAPSLAHVQRYVPLAQEGLQAALVAPALLGAGGPVSYLVVAQDPADIRPTGGFLGSWGVLTVAHGQVSSLVYQGYPQWEDVRDPQRDWPLQTAPMQRYMGYCCMAMQDANWYPDFPTTARALELFAAADQPAPLTGVIAFDPALVQALLRVSGPVDLPAQHVTVTAANLVDLANLYEGRGPTPPPPGQNIGKQFLTLVAQALAVRLSHDPQLNLVSLGSAILPLLNDKHVLLSFNAPEAAGLVAGLGWDGAVTTPPGDYLLFDDSSMSDNKIDGSISRRLDDSVQLAADGSAAVTARLSISNQYPYPVDRGAKTTDFRDFLRVYLPAGARAVHLTGVDDVWPLGTESGHVVASGYVVIPRGASRVVTVTYQAPAAVIATPSGAGYMLHLQTQPGIAPLQFHLLALAPDGGRRADISATLQHDQSWFVPLALAAGRPLAAPAWDPACAAEQLAAGLKGPYSTQRLQAPAACAAGGGA